MSVSPAPHEGPARDADAPPDPQAKADFVDLARELFGIDRVDFERVAEQDKAERAAVRANNRASSGAQK